MVLKVGAFAQRALPQESDSAAAGAIARPLLRVGSRQAIACFFHSKRAPSEFT